MSVEVALLNSVHIGDDDLSAVIVVGGHLTTQSHHGEVLEQFTTDCTGTNDEPSLFRHFLLEIFAENGDLRVVSTSNLCDID